MLRKTSIIFGNWKENTHMMSEESPDSRALLHNWLNKIIKVKISDGRRLVGSFLCTDQDMNIILGSCQEFVHDEDFENEDPRILGLAMVPGKHIVSLEIDQQMAKCDLENNLQPKKQDNLTQQNQTEPNQQSFNT